MHQNGCAQAQTGKNNKRSSHIGHVPSIKQSHVQVTEHYKRSTPSYKKKLNEKRSKEEIPNHHKPPKNHSKKHLESTSVQQPSLFLEAMAVLAAEAVQVEERKIGKGEVWMV